MKLTYELLNEEFVRWNILNGSGRSDDGLRFGQYLSNKYDIANATDIFYIESVKVVYDILLQHFNKTEKETN